MLRFEWNALRVGDHVEMHDSGATELGLVPGVVVVVNSVKGSNNVGIHVTASSRGEAVLWPTRLAVHLLPHDPAELCWRCQAIAAPRSERSVAELDDEVYATA
jgi:hypothetical protein